MPQRWAAATACRQAGRQAGSLVAGVAAKPSHLVEQAEIKLPLDGAPLFLSLFLSSILPSRRPPPLICPPELANWEASQRRQILYKVGKKVAIPDRRRRRSLSLSPSFPLPPSLYCIFYHTDRPACSRFPIRDCDGSKAGRQASGQAPGWQAGRQFGVRTACCHFPPL